MEHIINLKQFRQNVSEYAERTKKGESFIVLKRSKPLFKLTPIDDTWEEVIDFTKLKKGGVSIDDVLKRL